MKTPNSRSLPLGLAALALTLACGAGCADSSDSDAAEDDSAITATEANQKQHALKDHVLVDEPASAETARALGIKTWNVFAGTDPNTGFSGTAFYASDEHGDAKYLFAVDVNTKQAALVFLATDGATIEGKMGVDKYAKLLADVAALKARVDAIARGEGPALAARTCALGLASAGLGVIAVIGLPFITPLGALLALGLSGTAFPGFGFLVTGLAVTSAAAIAVNYGGQVLSLAADMPRACGAAIGGG